MIAYSSFTFIGPSNDVMMKYNNIAESHLSQTFDTGNAFAVPYRQDSNKFEELQSSIGIDHQHQPLNNDPLTQLLESTDEQFQMRTTSKEVEYFNPSLSAGKLRPGGKYFVFITIIAGITNIQ